MCLLTDGKLKVAKEDIEAYKVVYSPYKDTLCTIYRTVPIMFNTLYISTLLYDNNRVTIGLHSYSTLNDAKEELESCKLYNIKDAKIIKGIIPKGAEYYTGIFRLYTRRFYNTEFDEKEIVLDLKATASNQIIYKEL